MPGGQFKETGDLLEEKVDENPLPLESVSIIELEAN